MRLLEKALAVRTRKAKHHRGGTFEHAELIEAWAEQKVNDGQVAAALGMHRNGVRNAMVRLLKDCVAAGTLIVRSANAKKSRPTKET